MFGKKKRPAPKISWWEKQRRKEVLRKERRERELKILEDMEIISNAFED